MLLYCRLQNSPNTRNTEKSYLLLLVRGAWCILAKVRYGDSELIKIYRLEKGDAQ